jgi:5'(3')-deoxyribonucleotidase
MNRKQRLAIDMDEVIADTLEKLIGLYKREHSIEVQLEQLRGKEFHQGLPLELLSSVRFHVNEPGFFRDLKVMTDSQQVVKELCEKYDVFIVSAATEFRNSSIDKLDWLAEHFPFISWTNIIFCGRKIVDVDIFIDDRTRNFADFDGRALLYSSPHNLLLHEYERVNNWQEVAKKLL